MHVGLSVRSAFKCISYFYRQMFIFVTAEFNLRVVIHNIREDLWLTLIGVSLTNSNDVMTAL